MPLFNENTCRIIRLRDYKPRHRNDARTAGGAGNGSAGAVIHSYNGSYELVNTGAMEKKNNNRTDDTASWINQKKINREWNYLTIRFSKHYNIAHNYKLVLKHMLGMVKQDVYLRYRFVFHIVPAIISHIDGNYYIVVRVRITTRINISHNDVIGYLITAFNSVYSVRNDLFMESETEIVNTEYFRRLFSQEFAHKTSLVPATRDAQIAHTERTFYASGSMKNGPSAPPMPREIGIGHMYPSQNLMYPSDFCAVGMPYEQSPALSYWNYIQSNM